ncbi:hypothetical protein ACI2K3_12385 [Staphylococcus cohnii]|uniref:hypothetical protein n=1 Tax=Staphylococcus cohnii TaxID=29382 RepID=UPI00384CC2CC
MSNKIPSLFGTNNELQQSVKKAVDDNSKSITLDLNDTHNAYKPPNTEQDNKDNKRVHEAQREHDKARAIIKRMQDTKRITAEQRTNILKALNRSAPLQEIIEMCIECISHTVNDKAFKNQAKKSIENNYK